MSFATVKFHATIVMSNWIYLFFVAFLVIWFYMLPRPFSYSTLNNSGHHTGKDLHYEFTISYIAGSPDGVYKSKILAVNGQFPGTTIKGEVGDILHVIVHNRIQDGQNTSIHWHGLRQRDY